MDLGTIKKRLENMYYWCAMECIQDFCVMISNCYAYYELEDAVLFAARKLHELFFNGVHQMPKEEKILENSNDHNSQGNFVTP
jgi:Bromodomain